jgi:hypothetical protein
MPYRPSQSVASTIAALQKELANEQFAQWDAIKDAETCMHEGGGSADGDGGPAAGLLTPLENQIGVLSGTIRDHSTELRAKELCLERTTIAM